MSNITLNDCEQFLHASKKVLEKYPELLTGLCSSIEIYNRPGRTFDIMDRLMHEHSWAYLRGMSPCGEFSDHRLYFLLFITQLTALELYDMIKD